MHRYPGPFSFFKRSFFPAGVEPREPKRSFTTHFFLLKLEKNTFVFTPMLCGNLLTEKTVVTLTLQHGERAKEIPCFAPKT